MSYYVTHENSVLNINNAHLKVSGNVMTDVMKLGAIEFAPPESDVPGTVNFTNVTTGVTTTSNLNVGGTLMLGTVEVVATTHTLENTTALGNVTSNTIQFTNATTGLVTTANIEVGTANLFVDTLNTRVGVGVNSPINLLHLHESDGEAVHRTLLWTSRRNSGQEPKLGYLGTADEAFASGALGLFKNTIIGGTEDETVRIQGNGSSWFKGGNVGIGTVSPDYKLHVSGGVSYFPDGISTPGYHAQMVLSGGGNVTWDGSNLLWSYRIIALPVETTEFGALGYINIDCPTTGTITHYKGDGTTGTVTCTSSGVPITEWTALWYVVTPGQSQASDQTKFILTDYRNGDWRPDSNWLLIATKNGDSQSQYGLKFMPTNSTHYTWIAPSFSDSWVNYDSTYNSAAYYKDSENRVHLRGLVKNGLVGSTRTIFTLPVGFRPVRRELFCVMTHANVAGRIDIPPDGRVIPHTVNATWVSLDNLSFKAA